MISLLLRLWGYLTVSRRYQFLFLLFLMLMTSFAETLSIGALVPFLGALTNIDRLFASPAGQFISSHFDVSRPEQLFLPLTVLFSVAVMVSGAMRIFYLWASTKLAYATGTDIGSSIYERTLYQPYAVHISRNSSEVISGVFVKSADVISGVLMPALNLLGSVGVAVAILITLFVVDPFVAIGSLLGFGLIYVVVGYLTRAKLLDNSKRISRIQSQALKYVQEGLGGIRNILLDHSQSRYCNAYAEVDRSLKQSQALNQFISQSPRYGVEAVGMVFVAALAYVLTRQLGGIETALATLGVMALGAQRLLPALQQGYSSWSTIVGSRSCLVDVLNLLEQPLPSCVSPEKLEPVVFQKNISIENVSFQYSSENEWVFRNFSLTISKGSRVGFVGVTGSGKSTLLDLIVGLLEPTEGNILVDDVQINLSNAPSWRSQIAYVPQAVYLADNTIAENIAFGIPASEIKLEAVCEAARRAQIADFIETLPQKYDTLVGERGVRLSGGQCQRIGIARALYKNANVIVFDEATSALDNATERDVMNSIESLGDEITVLIIAHRLTTLTKCDQIVELGGSVVKRKTPVLVESYAV